MANMNSNELPEGDDADTYRNREVETTNVVNTIESTPSATTRRSVPSSNRSRSRRGYPHQGDPSWSRRERMQSRLSLVPLRSSRRPQAFKVRQQVSLMPLSSHLFQEPSRPSLPRLEITVLEALEAASELTSGSSGSR